MGQLLAAAGAGVDCATLAILGLSSLLSLSVMMRRSLANILAIPHMICQEFVVLSTARACRYVKLILILFSSYVLFTWKAFETQNDNKPLSFIKVTRITGEL